MKNLPLWILICGMLAALTYWFGLHSVSPAQMVWSLFGEDTAPTTLARLAVGGVWWIIAGVCASLFARILTMPKSN